MSRVRIAILALIVTLVGIAYFAAEESYVLDIQARLQSPPTVVSKAVVKNPLQKVTQDDVDAAYFRVTGADLATNFDPDTFDCQQADTNFPILVPIKTCVWWVMRITVRNLFDNPISNVMVTDRFAAELAGKPLDSGVPVHVEVLTHSRGSSGSQSFETQYRLLWCVTGNLDEVAEECVKKGDERDLLQPGEVATLDMLVFTKLNPNGQIKLQKEGIYDPRFQEYTSPCTADMEKPLCYELNSGATAKWRDTKTGAQMSESTDPIKVGTIQTTSLTLNTDIDYGLVYPGDFRKGQFTLSLSESFLVAGGQEVHYSMGFDPVPCPADGSDDNCPVGEFYPFIGDYVVLKRSHSETDSAKDNPGDAVLDSKDGDLSDVWFVKFTAPDFAGCSQKSVSGAGTLPDSEDCASRDLRGRLTIQVTGTDLMK